MDKRQFLASALTLATGASALPAAMPGVRRYVQNHAGTALDGSPAPCDGFAEIWFDDTASMMRALTLPEGLAAQADAANFMDVSRVPTFVVEEAAIV